LIVVLGASSSVVDDDEDDHELVDAALLLRFLFLFLCEGGFVAAGGISDYELCKHCQYFS
jgi:hypothetical protein